MGRGSFAARAPTGTASRLKEESEASARAPKQRTLITKRGYISQTTRSMGLTYPERCTVTREANHMLRGKVYWRHCAVHVLAKRRNSPSLSHYPSFPSCTPSRYPGPYPFCWIIYDLNSRKTKTPLFLTSDVPYSSSIGG